MPRFSGIVRSITPIIGSTGQNWVLAAGANEMASVQRAYCGGQETSTTAMVTRFTRASGQAGALTLGNVEQIHPWSPTNYVAYGTAFATTQPTPGAGSLWAPSWNAHGGIAMWAALDAEEEWVLIGAATELCLMCRNSVGTGVSTYGVVWREP